MQVSPSSNKELTTQMVCHSPTAVLAKPDDQAVSSRRRVRVPALFDGGVASYGPALRSLARA